MTLPSVFSRRSSLEVAPSWLPYRIHAAAYRLSKRFRIVPVLRRAGVEFAYTPAMHRVLSPLVAVAWGLWFGGMITLFAMLGTIFTTLPLLVLGGCQ